MMRLVNWDRPSLYNRILNRATRVSNKKDSAVIGVSYNEVVTRVPMLDINNGELGHLGVPPCMAKGAGRNKGIPSGTGNMPSMGTLMGGVF